MKSRQLLQGALWLLIYVTLVLSPLFVMLIGPRPPGREFWRELSVSLGFVGLAMMTLQFVLTARFQWLKAPYGSDLVYHFHCQTARLSFVLILVHPLLLFVFAPKTLRLLNLVSAPWLGRAGVVSLLSLIGLVAFSIWRQALKIEYTRWRVWHGILATAAVGLAMVHILLVGHYVNRPWKQLLWVGYALFWVGLLAYTRLVKPILMLRRPYEVAGVREERGNAWTVEAKPLGRHRITFLPGQFAWITAWDSPFAASEHPFSIASSAERRDSLSFTIKELGDFTRRIKHLETGQKIYLDGPYGSFSIDRHPQAEEFVFIAGGVGIVPIMSMLRTLADRGDTRALVLIDANNTWQDIIYREEIVSLQSRLNLDVTHVLLMPPADWQGDTGFVTREILERHLPADWQRHRLQVFICGPQPMMDAVEQTLTEMGVWYGDFHSERFNIV